MNRIRERRIELHMSQVQLGRMSGLANGMISDFELGKRQPWPRAKRSLASALGLSQEELFPDARDQAASAGDEDAY